MARLVGAAGGVTARPCAGRAVLTSPGAPLKLNLSQEGCNGATTCPGSLLMVFEAIVKVKVELLPFIPGIQYLYSWYRQETHNVYKHLFFLLILFEDITTNNKYWGDLTPYLTIQVI